MNFTIQMGRLTKNPEVRTGQNGKKIARYTLAVDRIGKDAGADFIPCVAFDRSAEFAEKYFTKGQRVLISGRIQTGSYKNRDGNTVYTTDVIISTQEFADSKQQQKQEEGGFMEVPDEAALPWGE